MAGLTKLGLALIFVSIVFLLGVTFELLYVLLYRRWFQREPPGADDPEVAAAAAAATGDPYGRSLIPKELLLYFICLRNQSQNERALATVTPICAFSPSAPGLSWPLRGSAVPDAKPLPPPPPFPSQTPSDLANWGDLCVPQVVFTVAGGEKAEAGKKKEPVVLDAEAAVMSSAGEAEEEEEEATAEGALEVVPSATPGSSSRFFAPSRSYLRGVEAMVSSGEAAEEEQKEEIAVEGMLAASSTPCCSSRFCTPSMSPLRRAEAGGELELWPGADGPASDEEGFLSSDEKLPTD